MARCQIRKRIPMLVLSIVLVVICLPLRALRHNLVGLNRSIIRVCRMGNTLMLLLKELLTSTRRKQQYEAAYRKLKCNRICVLRPTAKLTDRQMVCSREYLKRRGPTKQK